MSDAAEVPVRTMPAVLVHEIHQLHHGDEPYFLRIKVIAEPAGNPERSLAARADLGRRIADLIRGDYQEST